MKIYQQKETVETAAAAAAVTESMWGDMSRGTRIKRYCSVHIIVRPRVIENRALKLSVTTFMKGIYNYIPETSHASKVFG